MIKKNFALSLLFAISSTGALRANECTENICNTQEQCVECPETNLKECDNKKAQEIFAIFDNAQYINMKLELIKKDDESWTPLAERAYAILSSLENNNTKEIAIENIKQIYSMAQELNVHGNLNMTASEEAPETTRNIPTISLEDIINSNTISITCTIEKCDNNCEDILTHAKTMIENNGNDCIIACVEGMCDAINHNGTISMDVK